MLLNTQWQKERYIIMNIFKWSTDGGKTSGVNGFFIIEWKRVFSCVILKFNLGTREAYHNHAFNAKTLWLRGHVREHLLGGQVREWKAWQWKSTPRMLAHKIEALTTSWAISFRGPWHPTWTEWRQENVVVLTHGRKECQ